MSKHRHRSSGPSPAHTAAVELGPPPPRVVAMVLAQELSVAVRADARQQQALVDAALCVGQWLADQGLAGRWDRVRPAEILRCLGFLSPPEREQFLFSLVGLLGHAALRSRIPAAAARQAIEEAAALTREDAVRAFARATAAQLGALAGPRAAPVD